MQSLCAAGKRRSAASADACARSAGTLRASSAEAALAAGDELLGLLPDGVDQPPVQMRAGGGGEAVEPVAQVDVRAVSKNRLT